MAKRTYYKKLSPRKRLIRDVEDLKWFVAHLAKLFQESPELYKQIDLSDILHIPVDAWLEHIDTFLDEEYRQSAFAKNQGGTT